jgi:glycosyltransferase involved in cell wall biosynthesis
MTHKPKAIITVINDLVNDQKAHKIALSLMDLGYDVTLVGRLLNNSKNISRPYNIKRFKLLINKGFWFYALYNIRLFFYYLTQNVDLIWACDMDTLLPAFKISKIKNTELVYDAHEYFSECPELIDKPKIKKFWQKLEDKYIPKIKKIVTVSDGIKNIFEKKYVVKVNVIYNYPFFIEKSKIEALKKASNTSKTIIYQGAVNIGRGLENLVKSMHKIDAQLLIIGDGDIFESINMLIKKEGLEHKIKMKGKIPFEELLKYTVNADVGVSLEEPIGLNYKLAMPNKLFDYIQARIPVLVSNLPEMKKVVEKYKVGKIIENHQPETIAAKLNELLMNSADYEENLEKAARELCWENQKEIIKQVVEQ